MDLLKRGLAPITDEAWKLIDLEAQRVLKLNLAARKLVDFEGPQGWGFSAVNTGRLEFFNEQPVTQVRVGRRIVQPLIETRIPLVLDIMELDTAARGSPNPDLKPVVEAAEKIARAEDGAIFNGYRQAGITGIIEASPHEPLALPADAVRYPHAVVQAKEVLREAGINGPYAMALGPRAYNELSQAAQDGYPILKRVREIIEGPFVWSPSIQGAVVLSVRGGDFLLSVGQDLSIGYAFHEKHRVELYITESFTFRVLEPAAAIFIRHQA
jgi:uncharacterized linocin/CFP29 family protein